MWPTIEIFDDPNITDHQLEGHGVTFCIEMCSSRQVLYDVTFQAEIG